MSTRVQDLGPVSSGPISPLAAVPESAASAVSWSAIWAGAVAAAAATLLLVILGTGLGFASLSPWRGDGPSGTTFSVMTAIWLIVVQWISSALGGYLAGRTRTKWAGIHTHEVAFRDTMHGFATWALATLIMSIIVAYAAVGTVSGAAKAVSSAASGIAQTGAAAVSSGQSSAGDYEIDSLFRTTGNTVQPEVRTEAMRILVKGVGAGEVSAADRQYLAELVAARAGISPAEAEQRVSRAIEQLKAAEVKARELADTARKVTSAAAICTALSMLIGAFVASVAAALGGRERDSHP
jgi:hypothetical protein